ncbi:unnamed protein product [Closterium sp. NIES-54]
MPQPAAVNTLRSVGSGSIHSGAAHAIPITREAAFSRRALHVPASVRLAPPSAASTTAYGARGLTGVPNEFRSQVRLKANSLIATDGGHPEQGRQFSASALIEGVALVARIVGVRPWSRSGAPNSRSAKSGAPNRDVLNLVRELIPI